MLLWMLLLLLLTMLLLPMLLLCCCYYVLLYRYYIFCCCCYWWSCCLKFHYCRYYSFSMHIRLQELCLIFYLYRPRLSLMKIFTPNKVFSYTAALLSLHCYLRYYDYKQTKSYCDLVFCFIFYNYGVSVEYIYFSLAILNSNQSFCSSL